MSETTELAPALSARDWAYPKYYNHDENFAVLRGPDDWNPSREWQLDLCRSGSPANLTPKGRHALAALALHGHDCGFTHEDVEMVRWAEAIMMREDIFGFADPRNSARFRSLAERIAALLPPTSPPP